jgi:hypothetical protein
VKANIRDKEDRGLLSRPSLTRLPVPNKLGASLTSSPPEGPPTSYDKYPPRTTSLCPAREAAGSHEQFPPPTKVRATPCGATPGRDASTVTRGGPVPTPCKHTSWRPARAVDPDRGLNTALLGYAAVKSPSSPTLQHTSSAQGTQAPPTTSSGLRLSLNVAGSSCARMD